MRPRRTPVRRQGLPANGSPLLNGAADDFDDYGDGGGAPPAPHGLEACQYIVQFAEREGARGERATAEFLEDVARQVRAFARENYGAEV
jgi:hypothetical protein